jgi:hypothetical protein
VYNFIIIYNTIDTAANCENNIFNIDLNSTFDVIHDMIDSLVGALCYNLALKPYGTNFG